MKCFRFLIGILILISAELALAKTEIPEILGQWQFHRMRYRGQLMEPMNPNLIMTLDFREVGLSYLTYHRLDEQGFCQRGAIFYYDSKKEMIYQRVVWVNPANRDDCGIDPDMQMNRESWSPLTIKNQQLYLSVPFGEEDITFLWKKI